jgi:hypothetical protein
MRISIFWGLYPFLIEGSFALINTNNVKSSPNRLIPKGSSNRPFGVASQASWSALKSTEDAEGKQSKGKQKKGKKAPSRKKSSPKASANEERTKKKEEIMKQLKAKLEEKKQNEKDSGLLDKLNPFQVGQNLRQTLGRLTTLGAGLSTETKQKYYLDDRFLEGGIISERNPYLERLEKDNYVPEILVIGATGEVGRLVVRRLLLEGRFRVRVLVRDLYSQTLNLLGTGVTYCQGDLNNMESIEYALTDVDKIVFCAGAPRPDESDFQEKFQYFMKENLEDEQANAHVGEEEEATNDMEWEKLTSVLEVRAQLAEQVDCIGMQNLVTAYQNVRHADYGTSQTAKRSLFKFSGRPEDFNLFAIDDNSGIFASDEGESTDDSEVLAGKDTESSSFNDDDYDDDDDDDDKEDFYADYYGDDSNYDDTEYYDVEERQDATVKSQVKWIRNEFGHGVFVGKVPKATNSGVGGEAAIASSRLRSREDPENGIDLSTGFAGFIVRLCGDGGKYEAFIRTGSYEEDGIEYVYEFSTQTKRTSRDNKSRNKFITVRLPFENFMPVLRKEKDDDDDEPVVQAFKGGDVRFIGFRFRSGSNGERARLQEGEKVAFYIALSFIKVYRLQPEPEFVYLSDARIPPVIKDEMVRHDRRQLLTGGSFREGDGDAIQILDEKAMTIVYGLERSSEETYYKFRGEEILKNSGLR